MLESGAADRRLAGPLAEIDTATVVVVAAVGLRLVCNKSVLVRKLAPDAAARLHCRGPQFATEPDSENSVAGCSLTQVNQLGGR